ncbi:hypothetical protein PMI21_03717 [Pseudomonas sp. GM18]|uniref:hypothetical protein n=1 Tax=Pseudomonas sp. GM18 TaxID=1144324 RepID=UPI0002723D6E|nr:hypothetical protein [Pseudomonas sp. GM18]EJM14362.1 hypothetical protein PMI21_03717 [Pseudomonas sp. GM18]
MNVTYTLKHAVGKRQKIMFDGIIYASDILQFEGLDEQYVVTKRTLVIPFDIDQPITDVMLETEPYKP